MLKLKRALCLKILRALSKTNILPNFAEALGQIYSETLYLLSERPLHNNSNVPECVQKANNTIFKALMSLTLIKVSLREESCSLLFIFH